MNKELKDAALKAVQKKKVIVESSPLTSTNKLYKDYYNLKTDEPISLEAISKRIVRRFLDIEKASVCSILDVFFVHQNWTGFYSRTDNFSSYLNSLGLAKSTAYGFINSVKLLNDYFQSRGNQDVTDFMSAISKSIEDVGITKFIILSSLKNEDEKFSLIDRLLEGEEITASTLLKKPAKKGKKKSQVKLDGLSLKIGTKEILKFSTEDTKLMKAISNAVDKFYS